MLPIRLYNLYKYGSRVPDMYNIFVTDFLAKISNTNHELRIYIQQSVTAAFYVCDIEVYYNGEGSNS